MWKPKDSCICNITQTEAAKLQVSDEWSKQETDFNAQHASPEISGVVQQ